MGASSGSRCPPWGRAAPTRSRRSSSPDQLVVAFVGKLGPHKCITTFPGETLRVLVPTLARVAPNGTDFDDAVTYLQVGRTFQADLGKYGLGNQHPLRVAH